MSFTSKGSTSSIQPRKQRRYRYRAALHLRGHFVHSHLSKDLHTQTKKRAMRVKKGDTVKVVRGQYADKEGKIVNVDLGSGKIYIEGLTHRKSKGQEVNVAIDPSNVIITKLVERK